MLAIDVLKKVMDIESKRLNGETFNAENQVLDQTLEETTEPPIYKRPVNPVVSRTTFRAAAFLFSFFVMFYVFHFAYREKDAERGLEPGILEKSLSTTKAARDLEGAANENLYRNVNFSVVDQRFPIGDDSSIRVDIGVFLTDKNAHTRKQWRRQIASQNYSGPVRFHFHFVLGEPVSNATEREQAVHGDIVRLNIEENMNRGKSYKWFEFMHDRLGNTTSMVFKCDDDTVLCLGRLADHILTLDLRRRIYYGEMVSLDDCVVSRWEQLPCPPRGCRTINESCFVYHSGQFYGFTTSLLRGLIPFARRTGPAKWGPEDLMMGSMLHKYLVRSSSRVDVEPGTTRFQQWGRPQPFCHLRAVRARLRDEEQFLRYLEQGPDGICESCYNARDKNGNHVDADSHKWPVYPYENKSLHFVPSW